MHVMPGGDTEVTILGGDTHDENVSIDMNVTTSDHVSMSWTDEVPTGDMNTNAIVSIPILERTIAEFNKAYEAELQQQIESIKQEMADLQNTWELVDDAMKTIQINIESCNDLLNYLKYISEALGQLKNIKTLHEQEQLQEEQEQSIHDLTGTFKSKFLRELENPVNAQEVLDALMNSVSALEKLLTISEAESLKSVLDSGKSVSAKLAQIPELGMSVTKILTQAMTSTSNISVTEILEAQIAALKHGELHSLLSDFIEKLRTITDGKAAFTDFRRFDNRTN